MPGPKMGPRPADFDEDVIRQSPTYIRWANLMDGEKIRYACREFVKGRDTDDERLMRRIMIARRNNLKDHETLKKARRTVTDVEGGETSVAVPTLAVDPEISAPVNRRRRPPAAYSDQQVEQEMDVQAVILTRSYRTWLTIPDGAEFLYNQKYIKGKDGHDWLLRKNIWRRMRYRRENKRMMEKLKSEGRLETDRKMILPESSSHGHDDGMLPTHASAVAVAANMAAVDHLLQGEHNLVQPVQTATSIITHADPTVTGDVTGGVGTEHDEETKTAAAAAAAAAEHFDQAAVEAAVAVAADFPYHTLIHNPLGDAAALDAAAKLAIVTTTAGDGTTADPTNDAHDSDDALDLAAAI